ncbi:hypothetical protein AYX15_07151 [Cryptococcus neoformans]|nr:hypothetical protein AYX15_07151 [Cryptococcus neoformans var. grubii]
MLITPPFEEERLKKFGQKAELLF